MKNRICVGGQLTWFRSFPFDGNVVLSRFSTCYFNGIHGVSRVNGDLFNCKRKRKWLKLIQLNTQLGNLLPATVHSVAAQASVPFLTVFTIF